MKIQYVSENKRRNFFLQIMNEIKELENNLKEEFKNNNISQKEFNLKMALIKDAKLKARKSFLNGSGLNAIR